MAVQRDWFDKDFYKTLGVSKTASEKEITRAYRKLAKQFHPDANPGDKKAEERFKEASAAYDVLGDPARRKEYDEVRASAGSASPFGGATRSGGNPFGGGAPGHGAPGGFGMDDLGDLFGGLFNRNKSRGPGPQRGDDLEAKLTLSFSDAVNGVTTSVNIASDATCETCHGSGAEPGSHPVTCPQCQGRGVLDDNQGVFSLSRPCPRCGGAGRIIENPCHTCRGSGVTRRNRQVKVRIPAGVADGQRIRLKERGGAGRNGAPSGDLYVVVSVGAHELFKRKGQDLVITVPITYSEATLGSQITVPTLTDPVTLKVPAGTRSGTTLRVRGRGIQQKNSPGDLLVVVEIDVPKKLPSDQREAIESLARANDGSNLRAHLGVKQ